MINETLKYLPLLVRYRNGKKEVPSQHATKVTGLIVAKQKRTLTST